MSVRVRPLAPGQEPVLRELTETIFSGTSTVSLGPEDGEAFIAWDGELPVGFAIVSNVAGEVEVLAIGARPERRRRGVGTTLLTALLREARASGAARVVLEVREDNVAARRLYASHGLIEVGRRRAYYRDGADAIILAKPLVR